MGNYVYILRCGDGSLYTGATVDLVHRLEVHSSGTGAKYTRSHPVEALEGLWRAPDLASAARMEYAVKRLPREKKLLLLREPERLGALLPTLAAEEYTHQPGVSLEMCLEGQYDER